MINTRQDLNFYLQEDAKRNSMTCSWFKYRIKMFCGSESANVIHWMRHYRYWEYHNNNIGVYHKILSLYHEIRTKQIGLELGIHAEINCIGYGLRIIHIKGGGGILLNTNKIGNYCGFNSGVLLGNKDNIYARPTIGDHVAFGPGAKAIGDIKIGSNSFIAANAVVTKSFPENSIIGGIPAKLIKRK